MNHSILFVDDEANILKSLKRLLRKEEYKQYYCSSGEEGLEVLKSNPISVIVSDMRMPGMNGVTFLQEAMKVNPLAVKIILSGYADINDILIAINEGRVDSFLKKPWNDESLKIRLLNGCSFYEKALREEELNKELEEKNHQLENMNHQLEKKVKLRTIELQEHNSLLKMVVEGKPSGEILEHACHSLKKLLKLELVNLMEVKTGKWFPSGKEVPEEILRRQEIGKNIIYKNYLCYQLEEQKRLFGYLYLYPMQQLTPDRKRVIRDFSSILEMVLLQQNSLEKSDVLVHSIDSILEEMNEH